MRSITEMINEGKNESIFSIFKNGDDSLLSMIAKRIEKWDANSGKYSRDPMFLCDFDREQISWATLDQMNIEVGDEKGHTDGAKNVGTFDGFLKEYYSGESTKNNQYILGVFIDRCFIPIPDKDTFDKIWDKLNKD
jgi:hypothetical protein